VNRRYFVVLSKMVGLELGVVALSRKFESVF